MTNTARNYIALRDSLKKVKAQYIDSEIRAQLLLRVAASLALQGVPVSLLPGGVLHFGDVETFLRLRDTMPELNQFTVRAPSL